MYYNYDDDNNVIHVDGSTGDSAAGTDPEPAAPVQESAPESYVSPVRNTVDSAAPSRPWQEPIYSAQPKTAAQFYSPGFHTSGDTYSNPYNYGDNMGNKSKKEKKKSHFLRNAFLFLLCLAICISAGAGTAYFVADRYMAEHSTGNQVYIGGGNSSSGSTSDGAGSSSVSVTGDQLSANDIYSLACEQVVGISTEVTTQNFFGQTSSSAVTGSGFIVSSDGYIMTNYHVVQYAVQYGYDLTVMLHDGTTYAATVIGYENDNDIAIIKISATGLNAATFGDSATLSVGDTIYAVGNPLGELTYTMTSGMVSATDRIISTDISSNVNMFQIDAAVNQGNSGGPVYNTRGEIVGIVTAKSSTTGVDGIGFAIPINDAASIVADILENGYVSGKAYLGVSIQDVTNTYASYFNLPQGAYIYSVVPDSCADRAGLKTGDVITAVDGVTITSTSDLKAALKNYNPGDRATVTVYRSGESLEFPVVFDESIPTTDRASQTPSAPSAER